MAFDPMTAYQAAKIAVELTKDGKLGKMLMIMVVVITLPVAMLAALPLVLFSNPTDTPEITVTLNDYLQVSSDLGLSYGHLVSYDTGQYNNDFVGVTRDDIVTSAFRFIDYIINEYELIEVRVDLTDEQVANSNAQYLLYDDINDVYYYYETTREILYTDFIDTLEDMKAYMNVTSLTSAQISTKLDELRGNELYEVQTVFHNFDDVVADLDTEMREYAIELVNSGIYESPEFNLNLYDDIDLANLIEYDRGNGYIPYYHQADARWAIASYGSSTIFSGGCGPTSLAMVVSGLTNNDAITPLVVADWSVANGHRAEGAGSYWSLMTAGGANYGLQVIPTSRNNPESIRSALASGYPVIASMGAGSFTRGGHFIVLYGISSDGKVIVYDPASVTRSEVTWDLDLIMRESSKNGGENGSPFWIFKR